MSTKVSFLCTLSKDGSISVADQTIKPEGLKVALDALKKVRASSYERLTDSKTITATLEQKEGAFYLSLTTNSTTTPLKITRSQAGGIIGTAKLEEMAPSPKSSLPVLSTLALVSGLATAIYSPTLAVVPITLGVAGLVSSCMSGSGKKDDAKAVSPPIPVPVTPRQYAPVTPATIYPPESLEPVGPTVATPTSARALITTFDRCWDPATKKYEGIKFDPAAFRKTLADHNTQFKPMHNPATDYGFIEKKDLPAGTKIFVRADLHGDLKSLLENLKTLQQQGLLDANYKCRPDVQLVFLGDYEDRGTNTMQVLQVLTALRMENPGQVTLIRGNHESVPLNLDYAGRDDPDFNLFLSKTEDQDLLVQFYRTMPFTVYMGEQTSGTRQYTQFTHGTFELYADPSTMLESSSKTAQMAIPRCTATTALSSRITQLISHGSEATKKDIKLKTSAMRVFNLWRQQQKVRISNEEFEITAFNWGDVDNASEFHSIGFRNWKLSPEDVKHYLRLSSPKHPVKMAFRGHEHRKQHWEHNKKVVVSTMPVGMDSAGYANRFPGQADTAYILTTAPKVKGWTKVAYLRDPGQTTKQITKPYPIRSMEV